MKPSKTVVAVTLAAAVLAASPAFAGGRHHHHGPRVSFGFHFGAPLYYHHYRPAYYYAPAPIYYPAPVVIQSAPQVYTERADAATLPAPEAQQYWHYCSSSRGYYPYVKECPGGWERVPAAPAR